ncbi:MAG: 30S ribosome-binding factor RbfA [Patescibacteria group bacterium]
MSTRVLRVNSLIQQELNKFFLKELDFNIDTLVTITRVDTYSNLIESNVYISVWPETKKENILAFLNRRIYFIQQELNKRLKMRPVPKIRFLAEKLTIEAGQIEEVLEKLKKTAG